MFVVEEIRPIEKPKTSRVLSIEPDQLRQIAAHIEHRAKEINSLEAVLYPLTDDIILVFKKPAPETYPAITTEDKIAWVQE